MDSKYTYDRTVQVAPRCHPHSSRRCCPHASRRVPPALALTQTPACFQAVLPRCLLAVPPHAPSLFLLGFCSSRTHPRDRWPDVSEVHVSIAIPASDGGYPRRGVNTRPGNVFLPPSSLLMLRCYPPTFHVFEQMNRSVISEGCYCKTIN